MSASDLYHRIVSSFRNGSVLSTRADGPYQILQVKLSDIETRDNVVNPGYYGFSSRPKPGAQVLISVPGGNSPGGVVIASGDQRFTIALAEGEVALFDDQGQSITLSRSGITIQSGNLPISITGNLTITGLLNVTGEITAKSGTANKVTMTQHRHAGNNAVPTPGS